MEIKTERLTLVPLGERFLDTVHDYAGDPENTRFMRDLPSYTKEDTRRFLKKCDREWAKEVPGFYEFAVLKDGTHVGAISLYPDETRESAELGWITNKAYWGHGYAFEAVQAVLRFAVDELDIHHFIAHCDKENAASFRFMEKLGMVRTAEYGGRRNKGSDEDRIEYLYECRLP